MKRNWVIIILTIFVLLVVVLFVVRLRYSSQQEINTQFQEHQLLLAQNLAGQIESFFWGHSLGLEAFPPSSFSPDDGMKELRLDIQAYSKRMEENYIKSISLYDENGRTIYSTDASTIGVNKSLSDCFVWAKKEEHKGKVFVSPLFQTAPNHSLQTNSIQNDPPAYLKFFLAIPLYYGVRDGKDPGTKEKFAGILSFTINLKEFLAKEIDSFKLLMHHVWIIDNDGKLLFHSEHPEMALRNIRHTDGSCNQCHVSFDYVEKILKERQGTVNYQIRKYPKKLAAFAPMKFGNASWIVVVGSEYDRITPFTQRSLKSYIMLIGIVVFALISSSMIINRGHQSKIRAEEGARHWQEKILEREKAGEALRKSEERYRMLVDTMNDGLAAQDENGLWTYVNERLCEMSGYSRDEIIGHPLADFLDEPNWNVFKEQMARRRRGEHEPYEMAWLRKDGQSMFTIVSPRPIFDPDGQFKGSFAVITDITERMRAEEALKKSENRLRLLSSRILNAQETERRRISSELHDELGQALATFKLRLGFIEKRLHKEQTELRHECGQILEYVDHVNENVRRFSRDLSPHVLEYFGLTVALRRLMSDFAKNHNVKVTMDIIETDHFFPQDDQRILYRIFQEVMNNTGKHAQATLFSVIMKREDGAISFMLEDDGKGFNIMNGAHRNGLGLAILNERVRMLGGRLEVWSQEGKGTRITFSVPIVKEGNI